MPLSVIRESDRFRLRIPPYPGIDELIESIRTHGQANPLLVRPMADLKLELLAGYCRLLALERLKAPYALVRVFRDLDDDQAYDLAVTENQGRNNMSEFERATICLNLQKTGRSTKQIAEAMGWTAESSVFRYLRLAKDAPPPLQEALQKRQISLNTATAFLDAAMTLPENVQRDALAAAAEHQMSAAEFKRYVRRAAGGEAALPRAKAPIKKLKDGSFVLSATRVDATDPAAVDHAIAIFETALKDARRIKKALAKKDSASQEPIR